MDIEEKLILHVACGALADDWSECQYVPDCRRRTASRVTKEGCQSLCIWGERPEAFYQLDPWQPKTTFSSTFHSVSALFSKSFSSFSLFVRPKHLAGSREVFLLPPDCKAHAVVWQGTDCMNVGQFSRPERLCLTIRVTAPPVQKPCLLWTRNLLFRFHVNA